MALIENLIDTTRSMQASPSLALVFHEWNGHHEATTLHQIVPRGPGFALQPGKLLDLNEEYELSVRLAAPVSANDAIQLIPPNRLFDDRFTTVWYRPAHRAPMHFQIGAKRTSATVTWPNLLFARFHNTLCVATYFDVERPTLTTALFKTGLPNVFASGRVCMGNALEGRENDDAEAWEAAFFESAFSHSNDQAALAQRIGAMDFWTKTGAELTRRDAVSLGETLGSWIATHRKGA